MKEFKRTINSKNLHKLWKFKATFAQWNWLHCMVFYDSIEIEKFYKYVMAFPEHILYEADSRGRSPVLVSLLFCRTNMAHILVLSQLVRERKKFWSEQIEFVQSLCPAAGSLSMKQGAFSR